MKPITRAWLESAYDDIRAMEQMLDFADLTNIFYKFSTEIWKQAKAELEGVSPSSEP